MNLVALHNQISCRVWNVVRGRDLKTLTGLWKCANVLQSGSPTRFRSDEHRYASNVFFCLLSWLFYVLPLGGPIVVASRRLSFVSPSVPLSALNLTMKRKKRKLKVNMHTTVSSAGNSKNSLRSSGQRSRSICDSAYASLGWYNRVQISYTGWHCKYIFRYHFSQIKVTVTRSRSRNAKPSKNVVVMLASRSTIRSKYLISGKYNKYTNKQIRELQRSRDRIDELKIRGHL